MGARLGLFLKNERDRVDAPALIRWDVEALALEDVAEVAAAAGANDFDAGCAEAGVFAGFDIFGFGRIVKRWPTAAGVEFFFG